MVVDLRRQEGQDVNRSDIDFGGLKLIVRYGKYNKRREIPLHESVAEYLKNYWQLERPQYIKNYTADNMKCFLVNNIGNRLHGDKANTRLKYLAKKAGIESNISLHVLRHSIGHPFKRKWNGTGTDTRIFWGILR